MPRRILTLIILVLGMSSAKAQVQYVQDWTEYDVFDGIRVEYKFTQCPQGFNKNKEMVVFRFENTNTSSKKFSWTPKWDRGNECVNCHMLDSHEFAHVVELDANELKEVDICQERDKRFFMFSKWITIYPGMDDLELTDFEFINVTVTDN
jgi:hypothetical protein